MPAAARLMTWAFLSCTVIALSLAIVAGVAAIADPPSQPLGWSDVSHAMWTVAYLYGGWGVFYAPWILCWPLLVRRFPAVEAGWRGVRWGTLGVAGMGGLTFLVILGSPIASDTGVWVRIGLTPVLVVLVPWAALHLARRLHPSLRPGVFAGWVESHG